MTIPRDDARKFAIETARIAAERQAEDVVILDLRGLSSVTDYFVIGSGTSDRQMRAVFDAIQVYGARIGDRPYGTAGYETATWMLLDYVDVVIHLFTPELREYYDLELLWGDAPRVEWLRTISA
jgi:ribosome-associated protein